MRRLRSRWPFLFIIFSTSQIFESQGWGKAPVLRPKEELLILDAPSVDCTTGKIGSDSQLPRNFRTSEDSFPQTARHSHRKGRLPSLSGLDTLNASGSAQFSGLQLTKILDRLEGKKILFIDLRQEPHGFINEGAVSWYGAYNAINSQKPIEEIEKDEDIRLQRLLAQKSVLLRSFANISSKRSCPAGKAIDKTLEPRTVSTEEIRLLQLPLAVNYLRIPVPDYQRPNDLEVDRFLDQIKALEPKTWIHFHCAAGRGRTTTFLVLYDMLKNCSKISYLDIIERQKILGGTDLLNTKSKTDPQRRKWADERLKFLNRFYEYCREEGPHFKQTWSKWSSHHKL
jgi:hypothetical protein